MAKASKEKKETAKKILKKKTTIGLTKELKPLEPLLGKKKFAKRVKKSVNMLTEGLKLKEVKKPTPRPETKKAKTVKQNTPKTEPVTQPEAAANS